MKAAILNRVTTRKRFGFKTDVPYLLFLASAALLLVLPSEAFLYNPFYVPFLAVALFRGPLYFLFFYTFSTALGLLKDISYGLELAFVGSVFILATLIPFKTKQNILRRFFPLTLTELVLALIYLWTSFSIGALFNVVFSFLIACHFFTVFLKIGTGIRQRSKLDSSIVAMTLIYLGLLFSFNTQVSLFVYLAAGISFYVYDSKITDRLAFIFVFAIVEALAVKVDFYILEVLTVPFLLVFIPAGKPTLYTLSAAAPLIYIAAYRNFYRQAEFYLLIAAILCAYVVFGWADYIIVQSGTEDSFAVEKVGKLEKNLTRIRDYLSLLGESCTRESLTPAAKTELIRDKELCDRCSEKENCSIRTEFMVMLETKNSKEAAAKVERLCLYPAKLLYRLRTLRPVYEREKIKSELAATQRAEKAGEIAKILKPVDSLLKVKSDPVDLISALQARGFPINSLSTAGKNISIMSEVKIDGEQLAAELSKILNNSYRLLSSEFSFLDKCHCLTFTQGAKYTVKVELARHAYGKISGDVVKTANRDGFFHVILSDGMGHGDDSYKISTYLIDVFQTVTELGLTPDEAVDETNRLVKLKSGEEDYATLDYLRIDLNDLKAVLYKFGTYVSYLFRDNVLYEYDRVFLPLGIVDEPDISPTIFTLKEGDVFMLASDGLNHLTYPDITACFKSASDLSDLKDTLLKKALEKADDDITVILLKISTKC